MFCSHVILPKVVTCSLPSCFGVPLRGRSKTRGHTHTGKISVHTLHLHGWSCIYHVTCNLEMVKFSTGAQSVSIGSPNGGKVQHNCASVQSELFSSSHWVGPRMTCLNLGESVSGPTEGGKEGKWGLFCLSFILGKIGCWCVREKEKYPALEIYV